MSGMKKGNSNAHPHQQRRNKKGGSGGDGNYHKGGDFVKRQKSDSNKSSKHHPGNSGDHSTAHHKSHESWPSFAEHLNYILLNLVGQKVSVQVKDGSVYEGIFHSATADNGFGVVLQMARKKEQEEEDLQLTLPINELVISAQDFVQVLAPEVSFIEDIGAFKKRGVGFITDTEISQEQFRMRELTPWMPEPGQDLTLGENAGLEGPEGTWDQFATNQKLFGVQSTYDEDIYTTKLDRSSPFYRQHHAKAQRIAVEIQKKTSNNPHMNEERGHTTTLGNEDEEDRYSSVIRDSPAPGGNARKGDKTEKDGKDRSAASTGSTYQIPAKRAGGRNQRQQQPQTQQSSKPQSTKESAEQPSNSPKTEPAESTPVDATKEAKEKETADQLPPRLDNPLLARQSIGLRPRSFSAGNIGEVVANRTATKELYAERLRIQKVLEDDRETSKRELQLRERGEKINPRGSSPRSPLLSPLVGHPEDIHALNLLPATPVITESLQKKFSEFKQEKQKRMSSEFISSLRDQKLMEFKSFSREIDKRSSAPNSPVARRRHTILSATVSYRRELEQSQTVTESTSAPVETKSTEEAAASTATSTPTPVQDATPTPAPVSAPAAVAPAPAPTAAPEKAASETVTPSQDTQPQGDSTASEEKKDKEETPVAPPAKSLSKLNPFAKAFTPKFSSAPKLQELPPPPVPTQEMYMEQPMMPPEMPYEMYDGRFEGDMMYPPAGYGYYVEEEMQYGNPMGGPPRMPYVPVPYIPSPAPQNLPAPPVNMFPQHGFIPNQGPQFGGPYPPSGPPGPYGAPPHMYPPPATGGMPPQHGKRMPPPMAYPPGPQFQGQYPPPPAGPGPLSPPPMRHHPLTPPTSGGIPLSTSPPMLSPQGPPLNPTSPPPSPSLLPQGGGVPYGAPAGQKPPYMPIYDPSQPVYPPQDPQAPPPQGPHRGGYGGYPPSGGQPHLPPPARYGGGGRGGFAQQPPYIPQTHTKN